MKNHLIFVFSTVALFCGPAMFQSPTSRALAIPEVESLADEIYRKAYNGLLPGISKTQYEKMQFLYTAYLDNKKKLEAQRAELQEKFYEKAREPLPAKESLLSIQDEINKKDTAIDESAVLTAYQIRQILSPAQLQSVFLVDFSKEFPKLNLSQEQQKKMLAFALEAKSARDLLNNKLLRLQYEREKLLMSAVPDENALLEKQNQINETQGKISSEDLKLKLKFRTVLDWQQRNKQFNTHRADLFGSIGLDPKQDEQIMELHCKRESFSDESRPKILDLSSELMAKYQLADTTQDTLLAIQKQIDLLANQARNSETEVVFEIRTALNPDQRNKLVELIKIQNAGGKLPPFPEESQMSGMAHGHHGHMGHGTIQAHEHDEHADRQTSHAHKNDDHPGHRTTASTLSVVSDMDNRAANKELDSGNFQKASELLEKIVEDAETNGRLGADYESSLGSLARCYSSLKANEKAEDAYKKLLALQQKNGRGTGITLNALANTYFAEGKYSEAEPLYAQSIESLDKQLGRDHPIIRGGLFTWAQCLRKLKRDKEAESVESRAQAIPQIPGLN